MTSRSIFLSRIRNQRPAAVAMPNIQDTPFISYDDAQAHFTHLLKAFGGVAVTLEAGQTIGQAVLAHWPDANNARVVDLTAHPEGETCITPHDYHDVDVAIVRGQLAVAENAAVWVSNAQLNCRSLYFLCQRLVMVVPRDALVHNMRDAYAQIRIDENGFGSFIAGSSRTADIEQSLVLGAHGAMAAMVIFE